MPGEAPAFSTPDPTSEEPEFFAVPSANEGVAAGAASGLENLGFTPDVVGHGFPEVPPTDPITSAIDLEAQGSAMQNLIDSTPKVENLGDTLNLPKTPDTGYKIPSEAALPTAEANPAEVAPTAEVLASSLEGVLADPAKLPEEFRGAKPEELKEEARVISKLYSKLTGTYQEMAKRGIENIGYTVEQQKNKQLGKAFAWVSKKFGNENIAEAGTVGRFLAAFADTYKERNEDLDRRMDLIEKTRETKGDATLMQKLGQGMQVGGAVMRYGRMAAEFVGWTAAAPVKYAQILASAAETGTRVAKEARLKNADVINETRISEENLSPAERDQAWVAYQEEHKDDPEVTTDTPENRAKACHDFTVNKAAEEAWAIYEAAEEKHKLDPKAKGEHPSAEDLKKSYTESLPADILKRLEEHPVPGDASNAMQYLFRKHLEVEVGQMQKKLEAIERDNSLTPEGKSQAKERYMDQWGNGKTLKDFDRMLTRQGTVDSIAMGMRYGTGVAKLASVALMGDSMKRVWNHFADVVTGAGVAKAGEAVMAHPGLSAEGAVGANEVFQNIDSAGLPGVAEVAPTMTGDTDILSGGGAIETMTGDTDILSAGGVAEQVPTMTGDSDILSAGARAETMTGDTDVLSGGGAVEAAPTVLTVKSGDNLTNMFAKQFGISKEDSFKVISGMSKKQLADLGLNPRDIEQHGADIIRPGQKINAGIFEEAMKSGSRGGVKLEEVGAAAVLNETTKGNLAPIRETTEIFPGTRTPPTVFGAEDAGLMSRGGGVSGIETDGTQETTVADFYQEPGTAQVVTTETNPVGGKLPPLPEAPKASPELVLGQPQINEKMRELPAELTVRELPRSEVINAMKDRTVDEVAQLRRSSSNINVIRLNDKLEAIRSAQFVAQPGETVGSYVSRFDAYNNRFGEYGAATTPRGWVDQAFWPKAYKMTPAELAADATLNPELRGPLNNALDHAINTSGFRPLPGESTAEFLKRYDDSFKGGIASGPQAVLDQKLGVKAPASVPVAEKLPPLPEAPKAPQGLVPERALSSMKTEDMLSWPKNKPYPWAVTDAEATGFFGAMNTETRKEAEGLKEILGRYPNQYEYLYLKNAAEQDPSAVQKFVTEMQKGPQSEDNLQILHKRFIIPKREEIMPELPVEKKAPSVQYTFNESANIKTPGVGTANALDFNPNGMDTKLPPPPLGGGQPTPGVGVRDAAGVARSMQNRTAQIGADVVLKGTTQRSDGGTGVNAMGAMKGVTEAVAWNSRDAKTREKAGVIWNVLNKRS